jgi:O-antigen/teichoic acid export membrane protein
MMCLSVMGEHRRPTRPSAPAMRQLLGYGAWITVSNVVSPLMVSFDRFVIGGLLSVAVVTYYVTPYQVATQFLILPAAVSTVLFPVFASLWDHHRDRTARLYAGATRLVFAGMFAATAAVMAIAPELLRLWLGPRFAELSTGPLRWLMVGMLANGVAHLPFAMIQSTGRSDWTAKLHLVEMPAYLVALVVCARRFGLDGVAFAWCLRAVVDLVALRLLVAFYHAFKRARQELADDLAVTRAA